MANTGFTREPIETNLSKETNFQLAFTYIPNMVYHVQNIPVPGISGAAIPSPTPLTAMKIPGDVLEYEDLQVTFLVDEKLESWQEIYNWMNKLYTGNQLSDFAGLKTEDFLTDVYGGGITDATLTINSNKQNPLLRFKFNDIFPTQLSAVEYTSVSDDAVELTANATFAYTTYTVEKLY